MRPEQMSLVFLKKTPSGADARDRAAGGSGDSQSEHRLMVAKGRGAVSRATVAGCGWGSAQAADLPEAPPVSPGEAAAYVKRQEAAEFSGSAPPLPSPARRNTANTNPTAHPMAEAAIGAISLSFDVLAGCIRGFALLSSARNMGEDASLLRTMRNLEEYYFVQWARKVGLTEPGSTLDPRLDRAVAAELLAQLEILLTANKLKERYKLELVSERPARIANESSNDGPEAVQGILSMVVSDETRIEFLSRVRRVPSENILPKRLWWAAVDRAKFESLVCDVRTLVQGLWRLLDPLQQDDMVQKTQLALSTVIDMSKDIKGLHDLQGALRTSTVSEGGRSRTVPLVTSAGIKAARATIRDDQQQYQFSAGFGGLNPTVPPQRRDLLLPPLSPALPLNLTPKASNTSVGTAL
jgi:hypothetical protein